MTTPANPQPTTTTSDVSQEIAALRRICRALDKLPQGARGRAVRWIISRYEREMRERGFGGEP